MSVKYTSKYSGAKIDEAVGNSLAAADEASNEHDVLYSKSPDVIDGNTSKDTVVNLGMLESRGGGEPKTHDISIAEIFFKTIDQWNADDLKSNLQCLANKTLFIRTNPLNDWQYNEWKKGNLYIQFFRNGKRSNYAGNQYQSGPIIKSNTEHIIWYPNKLNGQWVLNIYIEWIMVLKNFWLNNFTRNKWVQNQLGSYSVEENYYDSDYGDYTGDYIYYGFLHTRPFTGHHGGDFSGPKIKPNEHNISWDGLSVNFDTPFALFEVYNPNDEVDFNRKNILPFINVFRHKSYINWDSSYHIIEQGDDFLYSTGFPQTLRVFSSEVVLGQLGNHNTSWLLYCFLQAGFVYQEKDPAGELYLYSVNPTKIHITAQYRFRTQDNTTCSHVKIQTKSKIKK